MAFYARYAPIGCIRFAKYCGKNVQLSIACRTGVILLRFSGKRGQAQGEREVRDTRDGRGAKKITPGAAFGRDQVSSY